MAHDFKVLDSQLLVDAPILALRRDEVVMPGDVSASREVVEHLGAVAVVALDSDERIAMVYQYRHSVGKRLWELPAGLLDVRGEDELTGAKRELQEEAGLSAQTEGPGSSDTGPSVVSRGCPLTGVSEGRGVGS